MIPASSRANLGETCTLVIPARNEAANIRWVLERVPDTIDEVILVDRSEDGTADVARRAFPGLVVLHEPRPGKGTALRTGFRAASGDILVMIDADGSMDPAEIGRYVALLDQGFDLVKGSRHLEGGGSDDFTLVRSFGNTGLRILANALYSARFTDLCYGFLAFRRRHLEVIAPSANGFDIEAQLILRAKRLGLRITEVPTFERERRYGASKLHALEDGLRILRTIVRERTMRASTPPARRSPLAALDDARSSWSPVASKAAPRTLEAPRGDAIEDPRPLDARAWR